MSVRIIQILNSWPSVNIISTLLTTVVIGGAVAAWFS